MDLSRLLCKSMVSCYQNCSKYIRGNAPQECCIKNTLHVMCYLRLLCMYKWKISPSTNLLWKSFFLKLYVINTAALTFNYYISVSSSIQICELYCSVLLCKFFLSPIFHISQIPMHS